MGYFDTRDWEFKIIAQYRLKDSVKLYIEECCNDCGGSGQIGGGFKSIDGPENCPVCNGTGTISRKHPDIEPKPEVNEELTEHMRKAFKEFVDSKKTTV